MRLAAAVVLAALALAGCDPRGQVLTMKQTQPIATADQVQIYTAMPSNAEVVAMIEAVTTEGWTPQGWNDSVMRNLKGLAADAGANGVVVQGFGSGPGNAFIMPNGFVMMGAGHPVIRGTAVLVRR